MSETELKPGERVNSTIRTKALRGAFVCYKGKDKALVQTPTVVFGSHNHTVLVSRLEKPAPLVYSIPSWQTEVMEG